VKAAMSRSGYSEDLDSWDLIRWRGQVTSAIRGKRGQQFFRDLVMALDAMPEKVLIAKELENDEGVCALGSLGKARGIDISVIDPENPQQVSEMFNIAQCLAQETVYINDERGGWNESPQHRWERVRRWAENQLSQHRVEKDEKRKP
jgi:hypothetical protein